LSNKPKIKLELADSEEEQQQNLVVEDFEAGDEEDAAIIQNE